MTKTIYYLFLSIFVLSCETKPADIDPIPVHDNFLIDSKHVNEKRVINVWTPPKYKENNDTLPVLYMPDGGIKEDFPHIANTISKLIANKSIPPIILVGIENTERGRDLTGSSEVEKDAEDISIHTKSVASTLQNDAPKELIWKYSDEPNEKHNTIFRATKEKALTWILNKRHYLKNK